MTKINKVRIIERKNGDTMNKFIIDFKIKDNNITITYNDGLKKSFPYTKTNRDTLIDYLTSEKNIYTKLKNSLSKQKLLTSTLIISDILLTILSYIKFNSILLKLFITLLDVFILSHLYLIGSILSDNIYDINLLLSYVNKDAFLREEYLYTKHQKIIDFKKIKELKKELGYNYKPKDNKINSNKNTNLPIIVDNPKVLSFTKK